MRRRVAQRVVPRHPLPPAQLYRADRKADEQQRAGDAQGNDQREVVVYPCGRCVCIRVPRRGPAADFDEVVVHLGCVVRDGEELDVGVCARRRVVSKVAVVNQHVHVAHYVGDQLGRRNRKPKIDARNAMPKIISYKSLFATSMG